MAFASPSPIMRTIEWMLSFLGPLFCVAMAFLSGIAKVTTAALESHRAPAPESRPTSRSVEHSDPDLYEEWKRAGRADPPEGLDTSTWNLALLKALEWKRFEQLSAAYFRALKFRVEEASYGADGGVDLRLFEGESSTPALLVQCKAWNSWKVGVKEIREFFGVMTAAGVSEGAYLTTSSFSADAREFAKDKNIHLIDGDEILAKLLDLPPEDQDAIRTLIVSGDFSTPTCPSCGIKMVERTPGNGGDSFWGCARFPSCRRTFPFARGHGVGSASPT